MAGVDGVYDVTVKSPIGDQKSVLTVKSDGGSFAGSNDGAMGGMDIEGTVDGNTLAWEQTMTSPMPMTLTCTATVDGDTIDGSVRAGAFGSFPMTGTRSS